MTSYFDAIADGSDIIRSKPDPEVFEKAAQFLGLEAKHCAVIEDAEAGLEAAVRAGMLAIGYAGARDSDLKNIGLEQFRDLLKFFK